MDDSERKPSRRAATRKAVRKHIHKYGQPRDRKPELDLLDQAEGKDAWEKTAWLKAQRAALELHEKMDTLISREWVAQRVSEVGRIVADAIEKIPPRIAHELAAERSADKCRSILEKELRTALSALANALELRADPARVDVKKEQRKGHRGVKRARQVELQ